MFSWLKHAPQPSLQAAVASIPLDQGSNGVAAFLKARGVVGTPGDAFRCPLAVYLNGVNGPGTEISVTTLEATQWAAGHRYGTTRRARRQHLYLPDALRDFVRRFDYDMYPALWTPDYRALHDNYALLRAEGIG